MDKQTLSNYGWLVIVTLVLAIMLALATPFGTYVGDAIVSVANGFVGTSNESMDEDNISKLEQQWTDKLGMSESGSNGGSGDGNTNCCSTPNIQTYGDDTKCLSCNNVVYGSDTHNGIIPVGATYRVGWPYGCMDCNWYPLGCWCGDVSENDGVTGCDACGYSFAQCACGYTAEELAPVTYNSGDPFTALAEYDTYTYGGCEFIYESHSISGGAYNGNYIGFAVSTIDKTRTSYELPENINGGTIFNMRYAFQNCSNLIVAPKIPETVFFLDSAFQNCTSLVDISNVKIPANYDSQSSIFSGCSALVDASMLSVPNCITDFNYIFSGCSSLEKLPNLSNLTNVEEMSGLFKNCTSIVDASDFKFPNATNEFEADYMFQNCTSLKYAPSIINSNIGYVGQMYRGCSSLEQAPSFKNCPYMEGSGMFMECTSLKYLPVMENCPAFTSCQSMFEDCTSLVDASDFVIPENASNLQHMFNGCTNLKYAPVIPVKGTCVFYTFYNCSSLSGSITINSTPTSYSKCLYGTQVTQILGDCSSSVKTAILATK